MSASQNNSAVQQEIASVNGVALNVAEDVLSADELRQRACSELLRQAAVSSEFLSASDTSGTTGILSEAASNAIEALLESTLIIPEPSEDECRRHYAAHQALYTTGERVNARHILFAVTQGVDVVALRNRAETCLLDVRCHDGSNPEDRFTKAASTLSNCPSGAEGGHLGWLSAADCAPEFSKELFGHAEVGVLPRLVHSRFGFHVVEVLGREPGVEQAFEAVRGAVAMSMRQTTYVTMLRQYLRQLAGQAEIIGVAIEAAETPLDQ
ncbi:PpiC-type peptidyl-prolyl cis-trans isomerase [Candidatus Propionivibrio aalborgensis]|uniref:peptidylprolyl isomerase n=1 Tax=Candidatus Propionivibrio aalborgensis TaxID=1860101 RepID=A0A1A8XZA0_9RHOO|nr:peptidylprolyl isomerase [Candidatus Propionivibrio aalborgensis]SBT10275.1 PpiC-type peptidyl-prolyl cis-trans isomerase [Candidatus Propionivibrio aalborgensis]